MAHKLNIAYKIISIHEDVAQVEDLVHEIYSYFMNRSKIFTEFQVFVIGITDGRKIL